MSLPPNTGSIELTAFRAHTAQLLARGERLDKRDFATCRMPTVVREERVGPSSDVSGSSNSGSKNTSTVTTSINLTNNGSLAAVMYTDNYGSCIQCTVQGLLGPPRPQTPAAGRLNVHVEAPFLEQPGGAGGANYKSFQYIISNDNVDLALRELEGYIGIVLEGCFDLRQLSIYEREACWVLNVNVTLLSFDGGLRAGSLHAVLAALHKLHLPRTRLPNGDVIERRQLRLSCLPVACTFGFLAGAQVRLLTDTTAMEEFVADGIITVAVSESGEVVGVHQTGRCPLLAQALTAAVQQWMQGSAAVREALYG
ncbi:putative exosome-associated protein 2 [Leptomonas pyrrhocoris]|uniref:Ribosomal RNA-processing protein 43 n=1 Tax=Leptomonas pyrrhocoris TaxID=157538 RepID=A0A0N0DZ87_LEPPY|nr:putative exosome-associated protein 2 [Leptomonas pyrrhocoris]KPA84991.1 putative exosome-associated protein 2 [Leptomonas pyrrhocoris]|eukprot:XP_015663430.1 putative exosome-associated protein 2 [Leptomonas pyrrhocoris]